MISFPLPRSSAAASPRPSKACSGGATFHLRPLWEKVARTKSAPDDGSPSAETNPSKPGKRHAMWPDRRLIDRFKTEFPIVLAPMAGAMDAELVIAAAQGGALGSLPCALLPVEKAREQVNIVRQQVSAPVNMNFFCHQPVDADPAREAQWKQRLAPYYKELGL